MNEQAILQDAKVSFKDFLLKDRRNKTILYIAGIAIILQLSIFKYFYPFASYIHGDSFSYINAALRNLSINTYMIGYSMFLRAFSVFSTSDTVLVAFQYLLMQCSSLFLLFSLFFFYKVSKFIQTILLFFIIFNPLFLYMGNLVSSDALFGSLSLIWFSLLLWIIHRPNIYLIITHAFVIYLTFTIRYNALIYLPIMAIAFILSHQSKIRKIAGITIATLGIALFIFHTGNKYKSLTGIWQYSPFSGWQLANNAMYAYRYVDSTERKPVPQKFKLLDNMIREYFDSTRDVKKYPAESMQASTVYMWTRELTLYKFRDILFKTKDSSAHEFKKWASMGPFYKSYGQYIITNYPWHFTRYFILPNACKYYAPPVEFLESYNWGKDSVPPIAQMWFGYKSPKVITRTKDKENRVLDFYPILSGIINVIMFLGLLCFTLLKGWQQPNKFRKGIFLAGITWLLNATFTIFASSAALRFQSFPILLSTIFACILIDWLWSLAMKPAANLTNTKFDALEGKLPANVVT